MKMNTSAHDKLQPLCSSSVVDAIVEAFGGKKAFCPVVNDFSLRMSLNFITLQDSNK